MKVGGNKLTLAQKLLLAMGAHHELVLLGHRRTKTISFTKKGPGRQSIHLLTSRN